MRLGKYSSDYSVGLSIRLRRVNNMGARDLFTALNDYVCMHVAQIFCDVCIYLFNLSFYRWFGRPKDYLCMQ